MNGSKIKYFLGKKPMNLRGFGSHWRPIGEYIDGQIDEEQIFNSPIFHNFPKKLCSVS
jgi:hypothetical protein